MLIIYSHTKCIYLMPIKTVMSSFKQSVNAKKREYGGKWPKGGFVGIGDIEYKTSRKD